MHHQNFMAVYHTSTIQAWEKRWISANNSSFGLMQQAAYLLSLEIEKILIEKKFTTTACIRIWCGQGNNAGDGYLLGAYLQQKSYRVEIYAVAEPVTLDAKKARLIAQQHQVSILTILPNYAADVQVDALFGIGLNRALHEDAQQVIQQFNQQSGLKIAIDIPSGLHPNTGVPYPVAIQADFTFSFIGLKTGLVIAQAQNYVGKLQLIALIPEDQDVKAVAYFQQDVPSLPARLSYQHKGSFGHVLVVGGHPQMGGAVMMSAEAAMHCGSGKVTVLCDVKHHAAILARSPNVMTKDIQHINVVELVKDLEHIDSICFGMGLGRDAWGEQNYHMVVNALKHSQHVQHVVWDADALWFLASHHQDIDVQPHWIFTPHAGEAARLLNCTVAEIEQDRIAAIYQLQQRYGGQWVLKGAGSLSLELQGLTICGLGNAGMGTAGMGDVLAGMLAALKAQFKQDVSIADIVAFHAAAGDLLAKNGQRGLQAHEMPKTIYQVMNLSNGLRST